MKITHLLEHWINMDLDHLIECSNNLEGSLVEDAKRVNQWAAERRKEVNSDQWSELEISYSDDHWLVSEVFPNILRSALFVAFFSFVESRLNVICKNLKHEYKYTIEPSDIRGRGIYVYQNYLKKIARINFPDNTASWNEIIRYKEIRNLIVHNGGKLKQNKELENFIKSKKWVSVNQMDDICFSDNFYLEVSETVKKFFEALFKVLP